MISVPVMASTALDDVQHGRKWTAVRCPSPFTLAGCSCFSDAGTCRGATIERAAGGADACNVSHVVPRTYWSGGAEAHAMCVWIGMQSSVLGTEIGEPKCAHDEGTLAATPWPLAPASRTPSLGPLDHLPLSLSLSLSLPLHPLPLPRPHQVHFASQPGGA